MKLRDKIARVAKERKLELTEVAKLTGIPYGTLRNYLRPGSERSPSVQTGIALAKALNVDIEWLFDDNRGWPILDYHEPPPFNMVAWPPKGVTWPAVTVALAGYVQDLSRLFLLGLQKILGGDLDSLVQKISGNPELFKAASSAVATGNSTALLMQLMAEMPDQFGLDGHDVARAERFAKQLFLDASHASPEGIEPEGLLDQIRSEPARQKAWGQIMEQLPVLRELLTRVAENAQIQEHPLADTISELAELSKRRPTGKRRGKGPADDGAPSAG